MVIDELENYIRLFEKGYEGICCHESGYDYERGESFEIWSKVIWDKNVGMAMKVCKVVEEKREGEKVKVEVYYVITTDLELSGKEMREYAIKRWKIENNLFRDLNQKFGTKHKYSSNKLVQLNILSLIFIAWNIINFIKVNLPPSLLPRGITGETKIHIILVWLAKVLVIPEEGFT